MTLPRGAGVPDTARMAETVVLVGWTDDDLDHIAEVVAVEQSIAEAFDDDRHHGVRVVYHPRNGAGTDQVAAASAAPHRLAVTKDVAAQMLSMSIDSLERHVMPDVRSIRVSGLVRIPTSELDRWVADRASRALGER